MKRLPLILLAIIGLTWLGACDSDDDKRNTIANYYGWRDVNAAWLQEMQQRTNDDGTPYYETIVPEWNVGAYVLIHYFNDRAETAGNLTPMLTSTIDTRYYVTYCDGTPMDSSYNNVTYGPGIYRTSLQKTIEGWAIAFEQMHVGDTAEVIIPYASAYGISSSSVKPFSNLRFNVRLVDIPYYEVSPK